MPKTPGVYIEEIPKFPPSIAAVETAIPAFIGYTQKAWKIKPGDLINVPTKIGSIADYELYFGVGAAPRVDKVILDDNKNFASADIGSIYYMYDSLRLFYANGGGDCYIVSTGSYDTAGKIASDFTGKGSGKGIDVLEKVDEPTILVFPDNSLLETGADFYTVYDEAMAQCGSLQDRVALFHVKENDAKGDEFRSKTGIKELKYGMAYSPWLKVNFPKSVTYRDFKDAIQKGTTKFALADLTDDTKIKTELIPEYDQIIGDVDKIAAASTALNAPLRDKFTSLEGAYLAGNTTTNFQNLVNYMLEIARKADGLVGAGAGALSNASLKNTLKQNLITLTLKGYYSELIGYEKELAAKATAAPAYAKQFTTGTVPSAPEWNTSPSGKSIFDDANADVAALNIILAADDSNPKKMNRVLPRLRTLFDKINSAWLGSVVGASQEAEKQRHDGLLGTFPLYKTILTGIQNTSSTVPPSGAVAGIYAYVDRTRGVWKAPANVSISGIIGPKDSFTASELGALNVDPNSGKSINAIRSFTGKGTLVYGARTLAGNDNEWRYVSVRRFFNFVEESCKKATEQFVFEPNDANTWVRVQGMIENFLTFLWRQGALQGIKPEHAFYVAVGLGKTMTAIDILEGRMIIEIGMAAVRPAEFIILRFSHKMPES